MPLLIGRLTIFTHTPLQNIGSGSADVSAILRLPPRHSGALANHMVYLPDIERSNLLITMSDLATLSAHTPTASSRVTPLGAHLLSWQPAEHGEILWLSPVPAPDDAAPVRGGIPLCLPWFATPNDSPARPGAEAGAHGFARSSRWTPLASIQPADDSPALYSFELRHTGETSLLFPHSFGARLDIAAGSELSVTLTLTNWDDHPFAVEAAMHTYLRVGDVKDITIEGLDGERYFDKIRGRYCVQSGDVTLIGPTDRVYTTNRQLQVLDPKLGRRIIVDKNGSGSSVVWNPWSQGASTLSDVGEGEWQHFVCVETAAVRERAITLWPGHPHIMTQTLAVEALD